MRYFDNSKRLQATLFISILLHLCMFIYLYYTSTIVKEEKPPISVEYISPPSNEANNGMPSFDAGHIEPTPKLSTGKQGVSEAGRAPVQRPVVKTPETPSPTTDRDAKGPETHPIEAPKSPSLPGKEELIPSLDKLTKEKAEKEGNGEDGEEGKDEETVSLDSTDFKYTSYLHGVKFKIEGVWKYPEAAKKSALQGGGLVSFSIQRDGTLGDLKLLSSSGYPVLDEAILKAIRDAAPFNPMTGNMQVKKLNVVATFEYNLVVQRLWGR